MVLSSIQDQLQSIYDLNLGCRVTDFLVTDAKLAASLGPHQGRDDTPEKLLVQQQGDELLVSLYLAEELVNAITHRNPFDQLDAGNLVDFCTAIEGVSHFVYLAWNATHGRPVSQLEMELQSEVDKFVSLLTLLRQQACTIHLDQLAHWLFDGCQYATNLSPEEMARYQRANQLAEQFCSRLNATEDTRPRQDFDYAMLRRFYRKRHRDKLRECDRAAGIKGP